MSPRSQLRWFALLALAVLFALAAGQLLRRTVREHRQATLRFAHWQLEPGIRAAFDAIVRDYEALHPDVRIEQMSIPERIYPSWGLTQLVGGVAPDLIELGRGMGGPDVFRYFLPITEEVEQPNPYNAGTPLAHLPWRKTYADGMESAYNLDGFECYGASVFAATSRMYCNADLLREVTGGTKLPRTFEALLALGEKVRAHARRTGRPLVLIAGSRGYASVLFDDLLRGQIQRLVSEMNPGGRLPAEQIELQLGYLDGRWSLQHPGMRGAAELMRLVCGEMPPGFQQFGREDSAFHFAQGRALLLLAFSGDATGIRQQVDFPVQVFRIPAPQPGNSGFGANLLGPNSEGTLNIYGAFGLSRSSRQPALALDFLRYLTSQAANRKFARISGSLPVILGVEPEDLTRDLMPDSRGYPPGPNFMFANNTGRVVLSRIHLLTGPDASGAAFLDSIGQELASGIRADLDAELRKLRTNAILNDSIIEAVHRRALAAPGNLMLQRKFQSLVESQNEQEAKAGYGELRLRQAAARD